MSGAGASSVWGSGAGVEGEIGGMVEPGGNKLS